MKTISQLFEDAKNKVNEISIDQGIMSGQPCIRGTRIPVWCIICSMADGGFYGAKKDYPKLSVEQIKEALLFAGYIIRTGDDEDQ